MKKRRIEITRFRRRTIIVAREELQTGCANQSHTEGQANPVHGSAAPPGKIRLDDSQFSDTAPRSLALNREPESGRLEVKLTET